MQPSRSKRGGRLAKVILILLRGTVADGHDHDKRKSLLLGCGGRFRFPKSLLDVESFLNIRTRLRGHETFYRWMPDEA